MGEAYLTPEGGARVRIDEMPTTAGHGTADYLLFVDGEVASVLEAKKVGRSPTGVQTQSVWLLMAEHVVKEGRPLSDPLTRARAARR